VNGKICHFALFGSVTGQDGEGYSTNRFVSSSGRIVLDPDDWNVAYSVSVFKRRLPDGHNATWRAVLRGVDSAVPQPTRFGVEDCVTVAEGLTPGHHVLELRGTDLAKEVLAARFYSPERVRN